MRYVALSPDEITSALARLSGWSLQDNRLTKTLKFSEFRNAVRFMLACVPAIEKLDHHPNWSNLYDTVSIALSTHDLGNRVSQYDVNLATAIEDVLVREGQDLGYRV